MIPNKRGNSRRWIVPEVENSLRRLNTDWIDLYQIHRPDPDTDIEETLGALTDLQRQGKIRAFGSSTFPAHQMVQAQWVSERRGLGRFVTEQPPYSLLVRGIEADVLPVAQEYGMGVLPWSPLAGGWLSGGYRKDKDLPESRRRTLMPARFDMTRPENQRKLDAADALGQLADDAGLSLIHLALAFVMQHPAVTAPIIGPRTLDHLKSQLGATDVTLSVDILDKIDEIVPPGSTISRADAGLPAAVADRSVPAGAAAPPDGRQRFALGGHNRFPVVMPDINRRRVMQIAGLGALAASVSLPAANAEPSTSGYLFEDNFDGPAGSAPDYSKWEPAYERESMEDPTFWELPENVGQYRDDRRNSSSTASPTS